MSTHFLPANGNDHPLINVHNRMQSRGATRNRFGALVLVLGTALSAMAVVLDPPDLRCVSYGPGDQVTLTWIPPADPGGDFLEYVIWAADAEAGPFAQVATVPVLATTSTTLPGGGADLAPRYFRITTVSTAPPPNNISEPSATLATMFVTVGQSTPLGSAAINWNLQATPPLPSAVDLDLYLEYPIGSYTLVATLAPHQTFHQYPITICEDSLSFRVVLNDAHGCGSVSTITGAMFRDVTPPAVPVMVNVSVDTTTNMTVITWEMSPDPDTEGYIIVFADQGTNLLIDTVYGAGNTTYTWVQSDAGDGVEGYRIAAFDSCWSGTPPSPNTSAANSAHSTVYTTTAYDQCENRITVQWTPYVGWVPDSYALYVQVDGAAPALLSSSLSPGDLYQQQVQPDREYCYFVRADGPQPGQVSLSNKACRSTEYPDVPAWNYLRTVTVEDAGHILVVDSVDLSAPAGRYVLERSVNGGEWDPIATRPGGGLPILFFEDHDVEPAVRGYQYRVQVLDSCGNHATTSNVGTAVQLSAEARLEGVNRLRWNGYAQWAGQVYGYLLLRGLGDGPLQPLITLPPGDWEYLDHVREVTGGDGRFCYRIVALEADNPSGIDALAYSNAACVAQEEFVWVPNAFVVGGANPIFIPVLTNVLPRDYELAVFNRWGQVIWTTRDPAVGWDGQVDGQPCPQGVYGYVCRFITAGGQHAERHGTVTLLFAVP